MGIIKKYDSYISERQQLIGGKADEMTLNDIAKLHCKKDSELKNMILHLQNQLKDGIKVELEHTSDISKCREITMDHLTEDPNYYIKLKGIESEGEESVEIPNWNNY